MKVLGVDPGRDKCGLAVLALDGTILFRAIVPTARLREEVQAALKAHSVERVALGSSTSSASARRVLEDVLSAERIALVDEKNSTLEARALYFEAHPPRGWKRWLPLSAQVPGEPVDDFAAVVVARRLLHTVG